MENSYSANVNIITDSTYLYREARLIIENVYEEVL